MSILTDCMLYVYIVSLYDMSIETDIHMHVVINNEKCGIVYIYIYIYHAYMASTIHDMVVYGRAWSISACHTSQNNVHVCGCVDVYSHS